MSIINNNTSVVKSHAEPIYQEDYLHALDNAAKRHVKALRNVEAEKAVAAKKAAKQDTLLVPINSMYKSDLDFEIDPTFSSKADAYVTRINLLKETIPTLPKQARREVVNRLSTLTFDEIEALTAEDLTSIKGVGEKYAEKILQMKWELTDILVRIDSYEVKKVEKAPLVRQKKIAFNPNYNPAEDDKLKLFVAQDILRTRSELDEFVLSLGVEPYEAFISLVGYIESSKNPTSREVEQRATWKRFCYKGFNARGGYHYDIHFHGTNAGRKDTVLAIRSDVANKVIEFVSNKADLEGLSTEAKFAAYFGLTMPGTISLEEYCGLNLPISSFVLLPEYKKVFKDQHVDFVDIPTGTVTLNMVRNVIQNMFDGQLLFHVSDELLEKLTPDMSVMDRAALRRKLDELAAFTLRGSFKKGLTITTVDVHTVLHSMGVNYIIDKFGRKVDIDDIAFFADESVCKATFGETGQFKTWEEFCEKWNSFNRGFRVLITEHKDRPHALPFQQLQSLCGGDQEALAKLIQSEVDYLVSLNEKNKAIHLLGGEIAKIVSAENALIRHPWVMKRLNQTYDKLVRQAEGGVIHGIAHNSFVACDPIGMCQHIAWASSDLSEFLQKTYPNEEDFVTGAIPAGHIVTTVRDNGDKAVMSRNPSTDAQAQCVVVVDRKFGQFDDCIRNSTLVYTSVNSYEVTRIRGDHDGDHVCLTFNENVVTMAETANAKWGGRLIDWDAPSTPKHAITDAGMKEYFNSLTQQSQLGHWCDLLTSTVGFGESKYDHAVACWLVMAVNVFVDASKHGMDAVTVPEFVTDFLTAKDKNGKPIMHGKRTVQRPRPIYAMQAKDNAHPSATEKRVGSERCCPVHGGGNGDRLRVSVINNVPQKLDVDYGKLPEFNVNNLLFDRDGARNGGRSFGLRGCEELFAQGEFNDELGIFEGQGLWKQIVFERSKELKELQDSYAGREDDRIAFGAAKKNIQAFRRYVGISRLTEWAKAHGKTLEDVHDAVTFYTLNQMKYPVLRRNETKEAFEKRVQSFDIQFEGWVNIFGGMTLLALRRNKVAIDATIGEETDMEYLDEIMEEVA